MRKVDQSGLKTGQALTIILLLAAFILSSPLLVAIVAISQFLGALDVSFAPFAWPIKPWRSASSSRTSSPTTRNRTGSPCSSARSSTVWRRSRC
ncbi:MAG: DUF4395 family protein [Chloroflexi bacterium]|nr:DUF4395 family protein [Chloroflexota bacterium]